MSMTNVKRPGNPIWTCCKAKPANIVTYDDGSASVTCTSCASSYGRHYGSDRVHALPSDWKPTTLTEHAILLAEATQCYYWAVATHEDNNIAGGNTETYKAAHAALLAAYKVAWPHLDPEAIYEIWLDCNESAAYCAGIAARKVSDVDRKGELILSVRHEDSEVWLESGEIVDRHTFEQGPNVRGVGDYL